MNKSMKVIKNGNELYHILEKVLKADSPLYTIEGCDFIVKTYKDRKENFYFDLAKIFEEFTETTSAEYFYLIKKHGDTTEKLENGNYMIKYRIAI